MREGFKVLVHEGLLYHLPDGFMKLKMYTINPEITTNVSKSNYSYKPTEEITGIIKSTHLT